MDTYSLKLECNEGPDEVKPVCDLLPHEIGKDHHQGVPDAPHHHV